MNRKWILGSVALGCIVAAWACGGTTSNTGATDAGGDGTASSSGGSSGSSSGTSSDSGSGSGGSSGGSGSSSGGSNDGGVVVVEGGAFPCGQAVCNPPDVCCESVGMGGATTTCESQSSCHGVSESCTADTCPSGALCCGTLAIGTGGVSGSTECVAAAKCPQGTSQLCTSNAMCPTGEDCEPLRAGGGGGGGGGGAGGTEICRAAMTHPDGGLPHPDSGTTVPDAGAE